MSHEFYQIMVGAPTMSLYSWKQLAQWSIDYSCLSEDEKTRAHEIFKQSWRQFCKFIVEECGDMFGEKESEEIGEKEPEEKYLELLKKLKHHCD